MLHVTPHFDAGDIDKFTNSPFRRNNIVYHAKRRFPENHQNMHYTQTFDAVGAEIGDKELEMLMRYKTSQQACHNDEKIKFGAQAANPKTVYEKMARMSRRMLSKDGKPRGLLAHDDYNKEELRRFNQSALNPTQNIPMKTPEKKNRQRASASVMTGAFDKADEAHTYQTEKKLAKLMEASSPKIYVDVGLQRDVSNRQKKLSQQQMMHRSIREKAPHTNMEIIANPRSNSMYNSQSNFAKQNQAKFNAAREFGQKSLYGNDVSGYSKMMNQTMTQPFNMNQLATGARMSPISITNKTPVNGNAYRLQRNTRFQAGVNHGNGDGHTVGHALGAGDPYYRRTASLDSSVATMDILKKNHPGVSQENFARMMKNVPAQPKKNDSHGSNPLSNTFLQKFEQIQGGLDLAEQERKNRFKYGVKKPANVWHHEMDDCRIGGDQIRTNNFRGDMFQKDRDNARRVAGRSLNV